MGRRGSVETDGTTERAQRASDTVDRSGRRSIGHGSELTGIPPLSGPPIPVPILALGGAVVVAPVRRARGCGARITSRAGRARVPGEGDSRRTDRGP